MELRQETQLAVQRRSWTSTYTTTLRLYPNTTSTEPSVHQSESLQWGYKLPNNIVPSHQYSIKGEQEMIINPQQRHQSISTARAHQHMIPTWPVPELTAVQPITTPTCRLHEIKVPCDLGTIVTNVGQPH